MATPTLRGYSKGGWHYTSSSGTVTAPAAAVTGDQLVLIAQARTSNTIDPVSHQLLTPTGWTLQDSETTGQTKDTYDIYVYTRAHDGATTSWSVTHSGEGAEVFWIMSAWAGADSVAPFPSVATNTEGATNTTSQEAPSLTTAADGNVMLCAWSERIVTDGTAPGSMTVIAEGRVTGDGSIIFPAELGVAYEVIPTAGATGTRTFTDDVSDDYVAISLEIAGGATPIAVSDLTFGDLEAKGGVSRLAVSTEALTSGEAALDEEGAHLVDLVIASPYDSENQAETTLYLANGTYRSASGDTPASQDFTVAVAGPVSLSQSIFKDNVIGGGTDSSFGAVELFNERDADEGDADLDAWADYFWDDRSVELLRAGERADGTAIPLATAVRLQKARGDAFGVGAMEATLSVRDLAKRLDRKVQTVRFEGDDTDTGGPEEIEGRPCPIVLGVVHNLSPVLTNRADRVYLFHRDAAGNVCQSVDAAYIGGNLVDPSDYEIDLASGTVQLNVSLDQGKAFTLDVTGPAAAGSTVAEFVTYLASTLGPLESTDLSSRNDVFQALYPGAAGFYIDGEVSIAEVLDQLLLPGNYWTIDADGLLEIGQWSDPSDDFVDYTLAEYQIDSVTRIPSPAPARTLVFGYDRNYTPITEDGLVDAARSTARGQYVLEPYRRLTIDDTAVEELWPSAQTQDPKILPLVYEADAQAELDRYWGYSSIPWFTIQVVTGAVASRFRLGRVVTVTWPRFGLSTGVSFRIAAIEIDGLSTTLTLWRPSDVTYLVTEDDTFNLSTELDEPLLAT